MTPDEGHPNDLLSVESTDLSAHGAFVARASAITHQGRPGVWRYYVGLTYLGQVYVNETYTRTKSEAMDNGSC